MTQHFLRKKTVQAASGFTLVEVMVSLSLFLVVVTVSVGTMLVLIDANKKAQSIEALINNVSIALDSMTREIRKGYDYQCSDNENDLQLDGNDSVSASDCNPGSVFAFTESGSSLTGACTDNNRIAYRHFVDSDNNGSIQRNICDQGWRPVTAPEINIKEFSFRTRYADRTDSNPPLVHVYISGEAGNYDIVETDFELQTTVTQRLLDTSN